MSALGVDISMIDDRVIACSLVAIFLVINCLGIKQSGKVQNGFIFFFWGMTMSISVDSPWTSCRRSAR